jgi:hypothetical protein
MPPWSRPGVMDEPDSHPRSLDDLPFLQLRLEDGLVHVSVHGLDGGVAPQLLEHRGGREVADVQDELRPLQEPHAFFGEPPPPPRQVRISEENDQGAPSRKRPSR